MIGRTVVALAATLMLGSTLLVSAPALGKGPKCGKLCSTQITSCKAGCTQTKKKDLRACRKACRKNMLAACKKLPEPRSVCSPSGAFLE
jgi:hypothetical protein